MKILYVSILATPSVIEERRAVDASFSGYAVQKFNRMTVEGLSCCDSEQTVLSSFTILDKFFWHHPKEYLNGINYQYVPSINLPFVRQCWIMVYCFFYTIIWGVRNRNEKALVCDVLNYGACLGAVSAAKMIKLRRVGIMTDMPGLMVNRDKKNAMMGIMIKVGSIIFRNYISKFTHYVFLTQQMNVVNTRHRPYIIMEGMVNTTVTYESIQKDFPRTILYAGGLHARYGLQMLIDAVKLLPDKDIQLVLYGDGPIVKELEREEDKRIIYKGTAPNELIVDAERRAVLLVNPRPTHEEFTKYSFPSKNIEYMASGTPLLTTKLPGMPEEYYPYVYLFKEETKEGYAKAIAEVLALDSEILNEKGRRASEFVLNEKNNRVQARRILDLLSR